MGRPKKIKEVSPGTALPEVEIGNEAKEFVNKDDFDKLSGRVEKILDVVEKIVNKDNGGQERPTTENTMIEKVLSEDATDNGQLPPHYQRIFEKYFDPEDGFTARLIFPEQDQKGNEMGGIMFTIVVPNKLSNAPRAHLDYYKVDLRSKPLQPGAIANGIENWCKLVANNLKYNRKFRIK